MFKRTCVPNNFTDFSTRYLSRRGSCEKTFFLVAVVFFLITFFAAPAYTAEETARSARQVPAESGKSLRSLQKNPIVVSVIINTQSRDIFAELDDRGNLYIRPDDAKALKLQYSEDRIVILRG